MPLDAADRERIAPYVSDLTADVFALSGLPEEVIAVLFAYYSRSKDDLRSNLARLLADQELDVATGSSSPRVALGLATEKARAFHERWVVGYGHASVAEHAVLHIGIENVSIIASKVIEDLRLGSFTEKSTRYVVFDRRSFVEPGGLSDEARDRYRAAGERLFTAYLDLMPLVKDALQKRVPRAEGVSDAAHASAIQGQACDLLRGLLPAGTRTNIGLTANARSMETLITKMMSHPLAEVVDLAAAIHKAALHVTPTLLKYTAKNSYRAGLRKAVGEALSPMYRPPSVGASATMVLTQPVRLLRHDKDALERVAVALAYEGSDPEAHASHLVDRLRQATASELTHIVRAAFAGRGPHDPPPRGLEAASMTLELMLDYGAFRDLQRHRLLSPATQRLTCRLGFDTPEGLADLGLADTYQDALVHAFEAWQQIEHSHPLEAQYAVPLAYRIRTLWTLNLREVFHVIELRSARQGHASYRRIAQGLYRMVTSAYPWLRDLIRVDLNDYGMARG